MSSETPIAPVPDCDTIVADVGRLVKEAHKLIVHDKTPCNAVAPEWVRICTALKRRLQQLQQIVDEVPAALWEIVYAGRDGRGLGVQLQPDVWPDIWREHEAERHKYILKQLANIKRAIETRKQGRPIKYPKALDYALELHGRQDQSLTKEEKAKIFRSCKVQFPEEADLLPRRSSDFWRTVYRHVPD